MPKLSLQDLSLNNQRVLMRVDYNTPLDEEGQILEDMRIRATLPSIKYILKHGGSLVLMSHLGRPKGKKNPRLSLSKIALRLEKLLKKPVLFIENPFVSSALEADDPETGKRYMKYMPH